MKIHMIKGFIQTMFLVEYEDSLLLLDSGTKQDYIRVKDFIENELKKSLRDLKLVVVTHSHPDHSGGAMEFKKRGVPIAGVSEANKWYQGPSGFLTYLVDIFLTYLVYVKTHRKKSFHNIFFNRFLKYDFDLKDSQELPYFKEWQAVFTPGHTRTDISLFHKGESLAYVADNIISTRRGLISPYPINFPELYKNSLQKYLNLGVTTFLLAHYNQINISEADLISFIEKCPNERVSHRNSLIKILKSLIPR